MCATCSAPRSEVDAIFTQMDAESSCVIPHAVLLGAIQSAKAEHCACHPQPFHGTRLIPERLELRLKLSSTQQDPSKPLIALELDEGCDSKPSEAFTLAQAAWNRWAGLGWQPRAALIVANVQNDFIDGCLALRMCQAREEGHDVVPVINWMRHTCNFDMVAIAAESHPKKHCSFYESMTGHPYEANVPPPRRVSTTLNEWERSQLLLLPPRDDVKRAGGDEHSMGDIYRGNDFEKADLNNVS